KNTTSARAQQQLKFFETFRARRNLSSKSGGHFATANEDKSERRGIPQTFASFKQCGNFLLWLLRADHVLMTPPRTRPLRTTRQGRNICGPPFTHPSDFKQFQ